MQLIPLIGLIITLIINAVSISSVYWNLVRKIDQKVDKIELQCKIDELITSVASLSKLLGEHIAYHKGKEDSKHERESN